MARNKRLRLAAGLAAGAVTVAVPIAATAAGASTSPTGGSPTGSRVQVQQGFNPTAIPGTTVFGTTPADTPETVSFVLKANDLNGLKARVTTGYYSARNFLSVGGFAREYGQPGVASELTAYLAKFGITTTTYADDLDVSAKGTAGEFDSALSFSQSQYRVPAVKGRDGAPAQTVHAPAPKSSPTLPGNLGREVLAVLGLVNYSGEFANSLVHAAATGARPRSGTSATSTACEQLTGLPDACNLPSGFENEYGLSRVESKAAGTGQTIGIVTLAALDQGAPEYFWQNVAHVNRTGSVSVDNIDGGPGAPTLTAGSNETDLDAEQSGAVAPGANVVIYQAPNTDPGFADAFFTAASDNAASSVSASWGQSEAFVQWAVAAGEETAAYQSAFDEAFLEFAAQGQSAFTSSGDSSAYLATQDLGTTNLSVDVPGDSPYITSAGGTTNPWSATLANSAGTTASVDVPAQRAWGWDYLWQPVATLNGVSYPTAAAALVTGTGGGYSVAEPRPFYQDGFPGVGAYNYVNELTPTNPQAINGTNLIEPTSFSVDASPTVARGYARSGRAEPDVSADADPETGYLTYSPAFVQGGYGPALEGGWGGTSFVAPQLNGSTAEIDSYVGHRVGFWNPAIYGFARSWISPFTPLNDAGTSNDNLYYTGGGAGSRYNPATGLGTPNLSALASDFAREG